MRHFTQDAVGKEVIDRNGEPLGTVAGIEDGNAILTAESGIEASMEEVFVARSGDDGRLLVTPDMVEESTDDWIRVHVA